MVFVTGVHESVPGSYTSPVSSAFVSAAGLPPPTTSTLPLGKVTAPGVMRGVPMSVAAVHVSDAAL